MRPLTYLKLIGLWLSFFLSVIAAAGNYTPYLETNQLTITAATNNALGFFNTDNNLVCVPNNGTTTNMFLEQDSVNVVPNWQQIQFSQIGGVITGAQLPFPEPTSVGGVIAAGPVANEWIYEIDTGGTPHLSQPAFSNISGVAAPSQIPTPTATTIGGIDSISCAGSNWINVIATSGQPSCTQPAFTDISGVAAPSQLPTPTATTMGGMLTGSAPSNEFANGITGNTLVYAQPAFSNLTGIATMAQLPTPGPTPSPSWYAAWDGQSNIRENNFVPGYTTYSTSGGTTTIALGATFTQNFTGSSNQTFILPAVSSYIGAGAGIYWINNNSTGTLTVESSGGNTIQAMAAGSSLLVTNNATSGTNATVWNATYMFSSGALVNPMTAMGQTLYGGASGSVTALGAQTSTTTEILTETGTGSAGQAPAWQPLSALLSKPTVSVAYSTGIGTGGFAVSASNYGYVFNILPTPTPSATAGAVYEVAIPVTISDASPAVITTTPVHNLVVNDQVEFTTTSALPSPLVTGTPYFVSAVPAPTTFQISQYANGASINTSSAGSGTQTALWGSYTIGVTVAPTPGGMVTTSPTLNSSAQPYSYAAAPPVPGTTVTVAPPASGTLKLVSGSGASILTFGDAQFYNTEYYGSLFTITAATTSAGDIYQDQRTVTITDASPAVFTTSVAHNLVVGQGVEFATTSALPSPLSTGVEYFISAIPASTTFQVSTSQFGTSLNTSSAGSGTQTLEGAEFETATGAGISNYTQMFTECNNWGSVESFESCFQPGVSGTLVKISGNAGSTSTITYSAAQPLGLYTVPTPTPLDIEVKLVGGGGGGAAANDVSTNATAGGSTVFGTALLVANGGQYGTGGTNLSSGVGGTGGIAMLSSSVTGVFYNGATGCGANIGYSTVAVNGGCGGASALGGAGAAGPGGTASTGSGDGGTAVINTGSGGGGGGIFATNNSSGAGGGSGGFISALITSPSATYLYSVGAGGLPGTSSNGGNPGGAGASGTIVIKENYQ